MEVAAVILNLVISPVNIPQVFLFLGRGFLDLLIFCCFPLRLVHVLLEIRVPDWVQPPSSHLSNAEQGGGVTSHVLHGHPVCGAPWGVNSQQWFDTAD